ncbi:MAG: protein kinase, partial [Anaerolineales bacterium]|nr:protein kinase [Anaerolineales bacterium]
QAELARRAGCAPITVRKMEGDALRPSVQLAELLALALNIPEAEQLGFVRLARQEKAPSPIPRPTPSPGEIGMDDLTGRAVKGFQLAELIGSGGFGVVYRAIQPSVQRDVAVKIILPRFANHPTFIRRFEAEAHLVARLEHPHIVPLYDYWREPGAAYLIMRLLRAGSLDSVLKEGPLDLSAFRRIVRQVGSALSVAHASNVVHRDIKPANILLDDAQNAYLGDFGIAKNLAIVADSNLTDNGTLVGSPAYISPEQIQNEPVRPSSDVYCFGLLLFEMLTGRKAFPGPTPLAYLQQHLNEPTPSVLEIMPDLPPAIDDVLQRASAKDPQARFPNMKELLESLETVLVQATLELATIKPGEETAVPPLTPQQIAALKNPFCGLRSFTEADADNFFGRETLVQELLSKLSDGSDLERFVAVVGPSGSGKSSLVKAGLLPALRHGGLPDSDKWFVVAFAPGVNPWEEVEAALLRVAVNPPESLLGQLTDDDRGLLRAVQRCLPDDGETELLLLIDQFEELFTLVEDEAVRGHFLQSLVTAVLDPGSRLRIVITLRADFTDRPLQYVDFGELMQQRLLLVLPLTPDELTQAITRPVEKLGLTMTPDLIATMIQDVGNQPGMLPLLQYALTELFEQRQGHILTLDNYQQTGGVAGALARRADEIFGELDSASQKATRQLFLRLITLGEGVEDTRRRVLLSELEALSIEDERDTDYLALITEYGKYRLLTFDHDPVTRSPTVEVAHEALLREWPRLRDWLRYGRIDIRRQRLLAQAAHQWQANNQDDSYLLRGSRLTGFEAWTEKTTVVLTEGEHHFLRTSLAARDQRNAVEKARRQRELETARNLAHEQTRRAEEQTRSAHRLRLFAFGLALLLLAAAGLAWFANTQRLQAQDNFVTSERIRLASQAQNALERGEGGEVAALLAIRSLQLGYSPEADAALQSALQDGFSKQHYIGHEGAIWGTKFTPDGRSILTASEDGTVRLWNAQTGEEFRRFIGHEANVNNANVSSDGRLIVSASSDGTARIWDIATGAELRRITGLSGAGWSAEFSPDGQRVAIPDSQTIKMWDVATGELVREFVGHTAESTFTVFSSDGRYLVSVSGDATARLWDVATGAEIRQFVGHTGWVGGADFSPDDRYLITTGEDGIARIWDIATGLEIRRMVGHTSEIFDGRFSPDGRYVATSGYDRTVRIWDVASGEELRLFRGHTNSLGELSFSPDGKLLVTGSSDTTGRLWDIWAENEPQTIGPLSGGIHSISLSLLQISADRQFLLIGRTQGEFNVWDIEQGSILQTFRLPAGEVSAGALAADNRYVVIGSSEGLVSLWDRTTETAVWEISGHDGFVRSVAFSADGTQVLSGGDDGVVRLWNAANGEEIIRYDGFNGSVQSVVFSPNGQAVLVAGTAGQVIEWEIATGEVQRQIEVGETAVFAAHYLPDGDQIIL